MHTVTEDLGGRPISIETGKMARQASGSVVVRYGDTVVLVAATADQKEQARRGFVPLSVHYVEKMYAAGKIPGSFFRREGRLSDPETLISRFIDRPIRPLFPDAFPYETQIIATVLSTDHINEPAVAAMLGASAALQVSDIPFPKAIAGVRVGRVNEEFVLNPSTEQLQESDVNLFVVGTEDAILMVEGSAKEVSEAVALEAVFFGHQALQPLIAMQKELQSREGKAKRPLQTKQVDQARLDAIDRACRSGLTQALQIKEKQARYAAMAQVEKDNQPAFYDAAKDAPTVAQGYHDAVEHLKGQIMRERILSEGARVDGRGTTDIRPISCEVGVLPRTHGSALFTRGETQALVTVTLGARDDEQLIDALTGVSFKSFLFHYNFPSFSVGEVSMMRGPGRREIGHGFLAEKGVTALLPSKEEFPYTIRVVSEILESNGSSSMASVCGSSLAMMDAGVPLRKHAAGIAMGLIQEDSRTAILSDILGDEDHLGDMDFKVAGTEDGITAIQMDIKIEGITKKVMEQALKQARQGRLHILELMNTALPASREGLSQFAPRFVAYKIAESRIKDLIGPGGRNIKGIVEKTGAKIDVGDDGVVSISSRNHQAVDEALAMVKSLTQEIEIGAVYHGPVKKIMDFGAFVELVPGTDGLVHISQLSPERVDKVEDVVHEGDMVTVKVIGFDKRGKLKLSMVDVGN